MFAARDRSWLARGAGPHKRKPCRIESQPPRRTKKPKSTPCKVAAAIAEKTAGTADSSHKLMHAEMQARIGFARINSAFLPHRNSGRRMIKHSYEKDCSDEPSNKSG
jgi:hypothetical protein